ncbi:hypothetical protein ACHAWT_005351 [Skeletonema menzelii]
MDSPHPEHDVVEASSNDIHETICGEEYIDLSTEAVAADAELLENIAYADTTLKRPFDESGEDITSNSYHVRKKKKTNNNNRKNNKKESKYDSTKLNDATTIEDLTTIDASAYLAWVNSQARSLPSVFVAEKEIIDDSNNDASATKTTDSISSERKEDPIDGAAATIQILLSKKLDILPPPTNQHIPSACNATVFNINNNSLVEDTANETQNNVENDTINNYCSNWVSTTISSFSKLRSYLERQDAIQKQNNIDTQLIRKVAVPKMKDRTGWHVFCLGREEAFGNQGGHFEEIDNENVQIVENNDDKNVHVDDEVEPDKDMTERTTHNLTYNPENVPSDGHKPTSSLLLQIDQVLTRVLFHHHVDFLCEWKFPLTRQRAAWIYALLARMNKPWHRDECCAVRKVLRECCSRRWELSLPKEGDTSTEENERKWEQLALLNTLISITGIYYEQGSTGGGDGMDLLFKTS